MKPKLSMLGLVVTALLACTSTASAQNYQYPQTPSEAIPLAVGKPDGNGFFSYYEMMTFFQNRTYGNQIVAWRGLVDSNGTSTGVPGTYIGSGAVGLSTDDLPRASASIGYILGVGYKLDDGTTIYADFMQTFDKKSHAGATQATPFFRGRADLVDTFLTSGVYNFPSQFAGNGNKTAFDNGNATSTNFYGIWNGASQMDITFTQRFTQAQIAMRTPLFQTEYSRIYGLGGARFDWFFERFQWRTQVQSATATSIAGTAVAAGETTPVDVANYTNTLSQRMYGPFVGCGHEVYLGNSVAFSIDTTAALLVNFYKERAKYELGDSSIQNKISRSNFGLVPSLTAHANIWWYPIEGVQLRAGYSAYTFFNTRRMDEPIGFNYSSIDPAYGTQFFRLVHGLNIGAGLFF